MLHISFQDLKNWEAKTNLLDVWAKEVELYSTNHECIKFLVGNKVDRVSCMVLLSFRKQTILAPHPPPPLPKGKMQTTITHLHSYRGLVVPWRTYSCSISYFMEIRFLVVNFSSLKADVSFMVLFPYCIVAFSFKESKYLILTTNEQFSGLWKGCY